MPLFWRPRRRTPAAYRKAVGRHDRVAGPIAESPVEAARRFSEDACAALPRIRVSGEGREAAPSPSDTVDIASAGASNEEYCVDLLETEMHVVQHRARRATSYPRLRPYLNRLVSVLNEIQSPRAHHRAVLMLSRFNEEMAGTRVGEWLRRAFEERQIISGHAMRDPFSRPHADTPRARP